MRTFVTRTQSGLLKTLLVIQMVLPTLATAQDQQNPCSEIIKAADQAIKTRDNVIDLQAHRIDDLSDENKKLSEALVEMKDLNSESRTREITYGVIGIVAGAVAVALIKK